MAKIHDWNRPHNFKDIQRFLGHVQYLAHFLPDITLYTGPLARMTTNGTPFYWKPLHEKCFQIIKAICCRMPILRPIEIKKDEPIWVICDTLIYGVGAMYGQGKKDEPIWVISRFHVKEIHRHPTSLLGI